MPTPLADHFRPLLEAASFAARAHRHQVRKDGETPYISHPFRVCLIVRHIFQIDDPAILTTALLHDTIEDTTTDFDDLDDRFGTDIARRVGVLSKDSRLPEEQREEEYINILAAGDAGVKISKLADIFDNLVDSQHLSPASRQRTLERSRRYLEALGRHMPAIVQKPFEMVKVLLEESANQLAEK